MEIDRLVNVQISYRFEKCSWVLIVSINCANVKFDKKKKKSRSLKTEKYLSKSDFRILTLIIILKTTPRSIICERHIDFQFIRVRR